jgi:hypothetical protein
MQRVTKEQLTPERFKRLDSLAGWVWDRLEDPWEASFSYLEAYVEQAGHARLPAKYKTEDGYSLGQWVQHQRQTKEQLTPERFKRLNSLAGWVWDVLEFQWEEGFSYLAAYVEQVGHARVPAKDKTEDGYRLGQWVTVQRNAKEQLTPERFKRLNSLAGWAWGALEFQWEEGFSYLAAYVEQAGHARVPKSHKTEDGYKLGGWVSWQRTKKEQLTPERLKRLDSLVGWVWDLLEFQWEEGFSYLEAYVEQEEHARVPKSHKTEGGYRLGGWVSNQRARKEQLTPERLKRLNSLAGWAWGAHNQ